MHLQNSRRLSLSVAFMITAAWAQAPTFVAPDDPNVHYYGRFDFTNPFAPRFSWPGSSIRLRFTATACRVILQEGDSSYYNVFINDSLVRTFIARASADTYALAQGLVAGSHDLILYKRTESEFQPVSFCGFLLDHGGRSLALPARPARRIEFIGDSHTAGLGNEGNPGDWSTCTIGAHNAWLSFGAVVGRYFGADYRLIAVSGKGIVNNHGEPGRTSPTPFPAYFTRTVTSAATPAWDFASWIPQVAVVNLGTNDVAQCFEDRGTIADEAALVAAFRAFLGSLRQRYPGVKIILLGPYDVCGCRDSATDVVRRVYQEEAGAGDLYFRAYRAATNADFACCHPRVAFHQEIADTLAQLIAQITGWTKAQAPTRRAQSSLGPKQTASFQREIARWGTVKISVNGANGVRSIELFDSTGRLIRSWSGINGHSVTWKQAKIGAYGLIATLDHGDRIEGRLVVSGGGGK